MCKLGASSGEQLLPHFSYTQNTQLDRFPPSQGLSLHGQFCLFKTFGVFLIPKNPSTPSGSKIRGAPKKCENKPHE